MPVEPLVMHAGRASRKQRLAIASGAVGYSCRQAKPETSKQAVGKQVGGAHDRW